MEYKVKDIDFSNGITYGILKDRGIEDPYHYLNTTEEDLNDPEDLKYLKKGVDMLLRHVENNDLTWICVDGDYDGFSSSSLLLNYLNSIFPKFTQKIKIVFHEGKQHGLSDITISAGVKFVLCPDSATNDINEHEELNKRGIDLLILD